MKYVSTRDNGIKTSSSKAIIQGLSDEGGLFVPETFPKINLEDLLSMEYKEVAFHIMSRFFTDFNPETLKKCIERAYDDKFEEGEITPIKEKGDAFFLELYHGPTLAFKDMALSILPYLLKAAMEIENIQEEVVILTATSGDTGKAALEGFANVEGTKIIVFFPEDGVSDIQKKQMITTTGENTYVVGIKGNFDDAQSGVKEIFNDKNLNKDLKEQGYILSSANSINIGRLIPQIVYYFYSYIKLLRENKIRLNEKINIVVPTGNFGNILAAYYGKNMGLPINRLICASNENNVLADFINTGIYDKRRELKLTTSPSMDILISSNLERLLYHISQQDSNIISKKMRQLNEVGCYEIDKEKIKAFYGDYSTKDEVSNTISKMFHQEQYLIDTHTAVAYHVYEKYREKAKDTTKTIIASTASPFKFGSSVASALGIPTENLDEFQILDQLSKETGLKLPKSIEELRNKEIIHKMTCHKNQLGKYLENLLKVGGKDD